MSEKVKLGIIGAGVLGRFHTKLACENPDVEVMGIFDVSEEVAKKVADEFSVKAYYSSVEELAERCDALTVAVPATLHYSTAMPLLAMNKHILMEKPFAATVEEGRALLEEAQKRSLVLGVGHVERFNASMDFLRANKGEVLFIEAKRLAKYPPARPGMHRRGTEVSVVLDLMIHDLDLVLDIAGSEVESFDASGMSVLSATEDIANARIRFKNGCVANVSASRISPEGERTMQVFQSNNCISMDFTANAGKVFSKSSPEEISSEAVSFPEKNALAAEIDDFVKAVQRTKESSTVCETLVSGSQGLRALSLALDICERIAENNKKYGFDRFSN